MSRSNRMGILSPEKSKNSLPNIASQSQYKIETCDDGSMNDGGDNGTRSRRNTALGTAQIIHRPSTAPSPQCPDIDNHSDESEAHDQISSSQSTEDIRAKARRLLLKSAKCRKRTAQVCQHIEVQTRDNRATQQREEALLAMVSKISGSTGLSGRPVTTSGVPSTTLSPRLQPLSIDFAKLLDNNPSKSMKSSVEVGGTMAQREEQRRTRKEADRRRQQTDVTETTRTQQKETLQTKESERVRRQRQAEVLARKKLEQRHVAKSRESLRTQTVLKQAASVYGSPSTPSRSNSTKRNGTVRPQTHHGSRAAVRRGSSDATLQDHATPERGLESVHKKGLEFSHGTVHSAVRGLESSHNGRDGHTSGGAERSLSTSPVGNGPSPVAECQEKSTVEIEADTMAKAKAAQETERAMLETMAQKALAETRGFAEAKLAAIAEHRGG